MYAAVLFSIRTLEQRIVAIPVWQFDHAMQFCVLQIAKRINI